MVNYTLGSTGTYLLSESRFAVNNSPLAYFLILNTTRDLGLIFYLHHTIPEVTLERIYYRNQLQSLF